MKAGALDLERLASRVVGHRHLELGWHPEIQFESGLAETVRWYRDNEAWWRPLLGRAPVNEATAWS